MASEDRQTNMENLENQEGRDLIKSINSLKRDFPPLVMVLMAFQMGGIHFVLSIPDWSLVWWGLFDVKNKGFLLGYTGQDWWCMKSRLKRGQQRKTIPSSQGKIIGSPNMPLCKSPLENCLTVYVRQGWWTIRWKWTLRKDSRFMVLW